MSAPRLARLALGSSLVWLVAGSALGSLVLTAKATGELSWAWGLVEAHQAMMTRGWLPSLAMGGAYLYLPRRGVVRPREGLAWAAVGMQHVALIAQLAGWRLAASVAQLLAALAFAAHAWPRIKRFGG